ncbi:hypothetical protein Hdeb2414_s0027g00690501 [Helianthus debilis subsp. tardiflorus]
MVVSPRTFIFASVHTRCKSQAYNNYYMLTTDSILYISICQHIPYCNHKGIL